MPVIRINGVDQDFPEGLSLLQACRRMSLDIPALCHDDRLRPTGACRLCSVEIEGSDRLMTACTTRLVDGMVVQTHSAGVESIRRTLLGLMAERHPGDPDGATHPTPFQQELLRHQVSFGAGVEDLRDPGSGTPLGPPQDPAFQDSSHPHLHVDLSRCILCHRCVRICDEVEGRGVWQVWNRGDRTLIRPDGPTLATSSCVSCGACADTCPSGALGDRQPEDGSPPDRWTRTTCPYCGVGCELEVASQGTRLLRTRPVLDAPVNRGHACAKGRYAFAFGSAPDRVTTPLVRRAGDRRAAPWVPTSWTGMVRWLARRVEGIRNRWGGGRIGILGSARGTNEEAYVTQKFARLVLGTHNVDCCARVCHAPSAAALGSMLGTGAATHSFDHIETARAFLVCGANPTENHPVVGARILQAVRRGAPLVVIDPRQTELAAAATVHLRPRPGTDVALLNAMAHVILEEGLVDPAVEGLAEFGPFIAGYRPETASRWCGVEAGQIRAAARIYGRSRPAMGFHGLGVTEQEQGTAGVRCLVNLALLTGNLGPGGGGVNPLRGQNNVQGAVHMGCDPHRLTGGVEASAYDLRFAPLWKGPLPHEPGLNLPEMLRAAESGHLKALWVIGYDIAHTHPDPEAVSRALGELDLVVVQDLFLNAIARTVGTVFLPAASSWEKDGTFMNAERRIQRVRQAVPPPGLARADWRILCDVARELGHGHQFAYTSAEEIWEEIRSVWPEGRGISYRRLETDGLQWPCPSEDHPGTTVIPLTTPNRPAARLFCQPFVAPSPGTGSHFPFVLNTGRRRDWFNSGSMTRSPGGGPAPGDTLDLAPDDLEQLGLHSGERVRVTSPHGEIEAVVRPDPTVLPGQPFTSFHDVETGVNRLMGPEADAVTGTPAYKATPIRIEKLTPQAG